MKHVSLCKVFTLGRLANKSSSQSAKREAREKPETRSERLLESLHIRQSIGRIMIETCQFILNIIELPSDGVSIYVRRNKFNMAAASGNIISSSIMGR